MPAPHAIATLSATIANIYTDGACSGNPGPGGWGVRIEFSDGQVQELGGSSGTTTNNRMEMQAAIAALEYIQAWQPPQAQPATPITLHTDSQYVIKGITQWIKGWKRKSWKTAQGKPVLNQDLWQTLDALNLSTIRWQHVKGHAGIPGNERCDAIATSFAAGRLPKLAQATPRPLSPTTASTTATTAQIDTSKKVGLVPSGIDPNIDQNAQKKPESLKLTDKPAIRAAEHTKSQEYALALGDTALSVENFSEISMDHDSTQFHESSGNLPRETRVAQVRNMVETLNMADEIADKGFLISSSELADLMDVNASAVTSRGEQWVWRNWVVSRVRREGNQILWQLERVD
ncbi:MAG: ribonuclease HI [Synechococcales cyanobacterium CRU_2_2]|nr:ribonuclease HI [Synechococcales cyanobacterium CRU_2_2]